MTSTAATFRGAPISAPVKQPDGDNYVTMRVADDNDSPELDHHQHQQQQQETYTRTMLKALTWRLASTLVTIIISLYITTDLRTALHVGFFEFLAKLVPEFLLYVLHERAWLRVQSLR